MNAAKGNRYGHRDATMILVAYRHGLRAASCGPALGSGGLQTATLHVRRVKQGTPSTHPILGGRAAGAAPAAARTGAQVALRVHLGARLTVHHAGFARMVERRVWRRVRLQGPPAHAAACLRLRAGE